MNQQSIVLLTLIILAFGLFTLCVFMVPRLHKSQQTEKFDTSYTSSTRYCAGCHAQLPDNVECICSQNKPICDCTDEETRNRCDCCTAEEKYTLNQSEHEDIRLYGYLISLLTAMGVNNHLHN